MSFPSVSPKQSFPALESEVLAFWKANQTFQKSIDSRPIDNPYRFYDGPPFITGMPHYGHMLGSAVKDAVGRYWTMRGRRVERTWGWDCHGLPIEERVQKKLGLKSNKEIEENGVKNFIDECYNYTSEISSEWNWYIDKIGRWVDMDNAYRTMDQEYMESVMWVFSELWQKGLIYEGKRVSLYSWKLGTPISNFEVAMDDTYQEVNDPAITVKFELEQNDKFPEGTSILAWTTTPWTIPANMALAVRNNIDYVLVNWLETKRDGEVWFGPTISMESIGDGSNKYTFEVKNSIVAKNRLETVFKGKGEYTIIREFKGSELVGLSYIPPFPEYYHGKNGDKNHKVYHADFITDTDGTGIGHEAPEFGEVDFQLAKKEGIFISNAMDEAGKYTDEIFDYIGTHYLDLENPEKGANKINIERMKANNTLFKLEGITHRVPFCPRSGTPLVQKAQASWFIDIQSQKDKLIEANEQINWFPEYLKEGRFKKGIETAPDWCISRTRYWGAPMPVWMGEDGEKVVVSSRDEIFEANKPYGQLTKLIITRHAESQANVDKHYDDVGSSPLSDNGKKQTLSLLDELKDQGVDVIITSPFLRAIQTAEPLARKLGIEIITMNELKETDHGKFANAPSSEDLKKERNVAFFGNDKNHKFGETGESYNDVETRMKKVIEEVCEKYPGKTVLIVSHGFPVRIATEYLTGKKASDKTENADTRKFILDVANKTQLNLHKPYIDSIRLQSPTTGNELTRIPEVLDVWMDSGSMPYAQVHFPFAGFEDASIKKAQSTGEKEECFQLFKKMWKDEFELDFHNRETPYEEIRDRFHNDYILYLGELGNIESSLQITRKKKTSEYAPEGALFLVRLGTIVENREKGLGTKLIKKALSDFAKLGEKEIYVNADIKKIDFYKKFGFFQVQDIGKMMGNTESVYMKKTLSKADELQSLTFPADFIAEYVGQIRAWFYVMHVLGVLVNPTGSTKPTPSFTNVITTGVVNGNDGRKMSKSFGNYPDPRMAIEKYGADPIRFYMLNSPLLSGGDMDFKEEGIMETIKGVMLPIWNTYSFFTTYANIDTWEKDETEVWFSRHAESTSNVSGKMSDGSDDPHITEKGREQAKNAGKTLRDQGKNFDVIIHTDRIRTFDTAQIIAGEIGFAGEYVIDDGFAEQTAGEYANKTLTEIAQIANLGEDPSHIELRKIYKNNSVENIEQFETRILAAYQAVLKKYKGKRILIVAHAGTPRPMLHHYMGMNHNQAHYDTNILNADPFRLMTNPIANPLDSWILSKLQVLIAQVHDAMEGYDISRGCRAIVDYMDELTNWYVRLSRRRFWESGMTDDKMSAYETLYTVLTEVSKLMAPLMPFLSENIYQGLTGRESVHLEYITFANKHLVANTLNRDMEICEHIVSLGLALRSRKNIRVRQPLASVTITQELDLYYQTIIRDELNVKEVRYENPENLAKKICKPDARKIGPKYGKDVQKVITEAKNGNFIEKEGDIIDVGGFILEPGEYTMEYLPLEGTLDVEGGYGMVVGLDTTITEPLRLEGYARDIIRLIQDMRKEVDYQVTDRIEFSITGDIVHSILDLFGDYIEKETLGKRKTDIENPEVSKKEEIDTNIELIFKVKRA